MISLLSLLSIYRQGFLIDRNQIYSPRMENIVAKADNSLPPNVVVQPEFTKPKKVIASFLVVKNKTRCIIGKDIYDTCISNPSDEKCKKIPKEVILDKNSYFFCTDPENIYNNAKKIL